ncbi:hypothetical protein ACFLY7_00790 [Patescibacteria group bacterium]
MKKNFLYLTILVAISFLTNQTFAYVSSSANYRLQSDSVSVGGNSGTSANYKINETVGGTATGEVTSASYKVKAGYQQMQGVTLSVSAPTDVSLTSLGLTQDSSVGSVAWTVATNNPTGYTMTVSASSTSGCTDWDGEGLEDILCDTSTNEAFDDLATTSKSTWSVSNSYAFGFSSLGNNTTGWDNGTPDSDCVSTADVPSTTLLWQGFNGNTEYEIASSTSSIASGVETTLCLATEQDTVFAPSGTYYATTTVTVLAS